MSNSDVSLVSAKVKGEKEDPRTVRNGKQQQTDVTDDHQRKNSTRRCQPPQSTTVKIAPRPANIQPMPSKDIMTPLPSSCIDMPTTALAIFSPPTNFLPGVDDNMTTSPLPFNNHTSFLTMVPPTAISSTSHYAMTPTESTSLPITPISCVDLSQAALLSVLPAHSQSDNQRVPNRIESGNRCDNDTMLKDLMVYYTPHEPPPILSRQKQTPITPTAEPTGQELIQLKEKKADNRERKKRWREQNEERNKDNDLRCRVKKRAHSLFGRADTEAKRRWVENEFVKRQCRRRGKERRCTVMDDAVSSTSTMRTTANPNPTKSPSPHKSNKNISTGHLPILQDAYLSMLLNNMGSISPETSLKLMEGLPLMEATIKNEMDDREHALPQQLVSFLQQLQKLHASVIAPSPEKPMTPNDVPASILSSPSTPPPPFVTTTTNPTLPPSITSPPTTPSESTTVEEPVTIGFLKAPPPSASLSSSSSSSPSPSASASSSLSRSSSASSLGLPTPPQHIQPGQNGLSAMLIQSLQQTTASYQINHEYTMEPLSPATTEYSNKDISQQPNQLYSPEAVMKLMQMNFEWTKQ